MDYFPPLGADEQCLRSNSARACIEALLAIGLARAFKLQQTSNEACRSDAIFVYDNRGTSFD